MTSKKFKKEYIGKGKKVEKLDIVKVTLKAEDLEKYFYEFKGHKLITFEIAALQSKDEFDRTHTVYVNTLVEEEAEAETSESKEDVPV